MFLKNYWYVAAWPRELEAGPIRRMLLNEPVVLYMGEDGKPAALEDRCCHRGAPLSLGTVEKGCIRCIYHGLLFDKSGQCIEVPGQDLVPPEAKVKSYPVHLKWNAVWIWMGDADKADVDLIPEMVWLDSPDWVASTELFPLKSSYSRLVDNLLDFSHIQFVHSKTIGADSVTSVSSKTVRKPDFVETSRWIMDNPPPPMFKAVGGFEGNVDRWMYATATLPSTVVFDIGCATAGSGAETGDRSKGIELRSMHLITPATDSETHYFWGYARNFRLDDAELTEQIAEGAKNTFLEDVEVLEAQQVAFDHQPDMPLIDINSDTAPLQTKRMRERALAAELEDV